MTTSNFIIKPLQRLAPYQPIWEAMRDFTDTRTKEAADEIWLIEHEPVYTLGQNGKPEHILNAGRIPIINVDRGGQVTYHGPGQLVVYPLINIERLKMGSRDLVCLLEKTIVALLAEYGIEAYPRRDAPGVYVNDAKICSLGLRIRRGCSYHGLALNVNMDLSPFNGINPCGYANMAMTQMADFVGPIDLAEVGEKFIRHLRLQLNNKLCVS